MDTHEAPATCLECSHCRTTITIGIRGDFRYTVPHASQCIVGELA